MAEEEEGTRLTRTLTTSSAKRLPYKNTLWWLLSIFFLVLGPSGQLLLDLPHQCIITNWPWRIRDSIYHSIYECQKTKKKKKKVAKSCTHVLNCVSIDPAFNISISFSFSFLFLLETPINSKNTLAYWTIDAFNKHNILTYWGFLFIFSTKFWTILLKSEKHILLITVSIKISHEFFTINWPFTSKQSQLDSLVGLFCFLFSSLVYQRG